MVEISRPSIQIDLNEFKLHLNLKGRTQLTLHFNSPSRRFYLSVIALVVNEMKKSGKIKSIPLQEHLDLLALLNESIGGAAGSSDKENLLPIIYTKWKDALPNLEEAPLFKALGRKKEEGDGAIGKVYSFTDVEKDGWAILFEYMGSNENVRLKFAADKIGVPLEEIAIIFEDFRNVEAWDRFISSLKKGEQGEEEGAVSEPAPIPVDASRGRKNFLGIGYRWAGVFILIAILAAGTMIWKVYFSPARFKAASVADGARPARYAVDCGPPFCEHERRPQDHGVESFVLYKDPKKPKRGTLVGSDDRKTLAVWNIASALGRSVGFLGWWASWPAEPVKGWIVSDRLTSDRWNVLAGGRKTSGRAWPDALTPELQRLVVDPMDPPMDEILRLVDLTPEEQAELRLAERPVFGHGLSVVKFAYCSQRSYERMALHQLAKGQPDLTGIFLVATDPVQHTFWHYYEPGAYTGVDPKATARLGARESLVMLPGAKYRDPELSWKYESGPAGTAFVRGTALGAENEGTLWFGSSRAFAQVGGTVRQPLPAQAVAQPEEG